MKLNYYKLHNEVKDPQFATVGSACFDICAYLDNPVTVYRMNNHKEKRSTETIYWTDIEELQLLISPAERVLIPTGLIFDIPEGYSVRLHPRSSISLKKGLIMPQVGKKKFAYTKAGKKKAKSYAKKKGKKVRYS